MLMNVLFEIVSEIFECALQRFHSTRSQRAKSVTGAEVMRVHIQERQVIHCTLPGVDGIQEFLHPWQSFPARRAKAARLLSKKVLKVFHKPNGTRLIIQNDECTRTEPAAGSSNSGVVH